MPPPEIIVREAGGKGQAEAEILRIINENRDISARARKTRFDKNEENWDFVWGQQDWSHKAAGQSCEFLPDLPMAWEQQASILERALSGATNWFDVKAQGWGDPILDPDSIRKLLQVELGRLYKPGNRVETGNSFPSVFGDGVRLGLAEATITFKIYAQDIEEIRYRLKGGKPNPGHAFYDAPQKKLERFTRSVFRLAIDPIPYEDFYPDPSPLNSFAIHEVSRGLHELRSNNAYNKDLVDKCQSEYQNQRDDRQRKRKRAGEDEVEGLVIRIGEHWGDVIDRRDGKVLETNRLVTVIPGRNDGFLRDPVDNPFAHGKLPFVTAALLRIPNSTVHRAILDLAVPIARVVNELANLMLDGSILSTWGVRQAHTDWIENADEIEHGVPPFFTGILNNLAPAGAKWLEKCDTGELPQYAENMLRRFERSFSVAMAVPQTSQGILPPRQVKATEIVEMLEATGTLFEAIAERLERDLLVPTLELSWKTIAQYLDEFSDLQIMQALGARRAFKLQMMAPEERFMQLALGVDFEVTGLRAIAQRSRQLRSLMILLQTIATSPAIAQAWDKRFSTMRVLDAMVQFLNLDPVMFEKKQGEGPEFNPQLLAGGRGGPAGTGGPESQIEAGYAEQNPEGFQGSQP